MGKRSGEQYIGYVLMVGCYYFGAAMLGALISVYLMGKGLSATQVSLVVSASCLTAMMIQPAVGMLLDRGDKQKISVLVLCLAAAIGFVFMFQRQMIGLLLGYSIATALESSAAPYIEKAATLSRFSYRSIRIWGTIGYGVGTQVSGIVYDVISPESICIFYVAAILLAAFGIATTYPARADELNETAARQTDSGHRGQLLGNGKFLIYMIIAALFYATTKLNSTYLPVLYRETGLSVSATSTVLFIGTLMELPVIFFASSYMNRLTNAKLLAAMFAILLVQFGSYAFIPFLPVKIAATVLLKSSVTMMFIMVNLKVVSSLASPAQQMSALTLVSAFSRNLVTMLMQVMGGSIVDAYSVTGMFIGLTGCAAFGLFLIVISRIPTNEATATRF